MKKIVKFSITTAIVFCIALFANAEKSKKIFNTSNVAVKLTDTLVSQIKKADIVKWLNNKITPGITTIRNKFIADILQNALFNDMYIQNKSVKGDLLIVPLKKTYFSQHISKSMPMPFQNLLIDIDKGKNGEEIFSINLSLIYPADSKLKYLPKNTFTNFYSQYETLDGTYALISILLADYKMTEMDIKNSERVQHKSWVSKKIDSNLHEWNLEITDINKDGTIKLTTQKLGTSKTLSPPGFKGDLRTKEEDKK